MMKKYNIDRRYLIAKLQPSFLKIDVLLFCRYSLEIRKENKIRVYDIWRSLMYYDYHYYTKYKSIKIIIISLFPLHKNSRKRNKHFKISRNLVDYWSEKFEINYQQHEGIYNVFKSLKNAN